ncbi:SDR family NAD(P)-dependent oxidoreductase [Rhodococcus sp. NPDC127530]|uniref:SDR family NAD(P)-dependent oxidoreductase n=1 Tax=unclassified Rhodococcus (in: high G+C Gram-positive bacteria) TaxID=192944 RepID=UPI00362C7D4F
MIDVPPLFSLEGRTALLTGATAGLGRRFAQVLVSAGARTVLVARREELLEELATSLGPLATPLVADLSDPEHAAQAARKALQLIGPIDVVVNNAAYLAAGVKAEDESLDDMQRTLAVNLLSPIRIVQTLYPEMRARGSGSIVNVSSIVASHGIGRFPQAVYAASKGGLNAITREWAAQWSRHGIRVNAIAPGFINTEITSEVFDLPKIQDWIKRNTLLPRGGYPDDFDGALLYLASDASRYVTGQIMTVDGGWTAH